MRERKVNEVMCAKEPRQGGNSPIATIYKVVTNISNDYKIKKRSSNTLVSRS